MALIRTDEPLAPPDDPLPLMQRGTIAAMELIPWGSNYTFATLLRGEHGESALSIYKPRRGEAPLRDFPSGTLYKREVAAYVFAREMGWNLVPPTIIREDAPHGVGSLQWYVEPAEEAMRAFDTLRVTHRDQFQRMALFDLLVNNADRKGGHCLPDHAGRLWGIDHGLTFHQAPKLRTVIWDFCGEPLPSPLVQEISSPRADAARVDAIRAALGPLLAPGEIEALFNRWDALLASPCYPVLDPYRNVPWPPF